MERVAMRMAERREETWRPMNRQRVAAFIRLYLLVLVYDENAYSQAAEKKAENIEQSPGQTRDAACLSQPSVDHGRDPVAHDIGGFSGTQ